MTVNVFFYHSGMTGAPVLSTTAGAMVALLDACLVNGFRAGTPSAITRSGSEATVTETAHGREVGQPVLIGGAGQAEYNGAHVITWVDTDHYKFDVSGTPATPATGSFTAKVAPAGWTKEYTGTNKAVYKRPDVTATAMRMRVSHPSGSDVSVKTYASMTGVDTGTLLHNGNVYAGTDTSAHGWILFADGKRVILAGGLEQPARLSYFPQLVWGDPVSYKAGDSYHCMSNADATGSPYAGYRTAWLVTWFGHPQMWLMRGHTQLGSPVSGIFESLARHLRLNGALNMADNGLLMARTELHEDNGANSCWRGYWPGVWLPLTTYSDVMTGPTQADNWQRIDNVTIEGQSRSVVMVRCTESDTNCWAVDVTGPWE
jgi:hypothetical protein